jgi:hypothetical protein
MFFLRENQMQLKSYVGGSWIEGRGGEVEVRHAINGDPIASVSSEGIDFSDVLRYGRQTGGPALRKMTIHERAHMLKALAKHLLQRKELFYELSARTGATRADSWVDIEGGIGTVLSLASIARRELPTKVLLWRRNGTTVSEGSFLGWHTGPRKAYRVSMPSISLLGRAGENRSQPDRRCAGGGHPTTVSLRDETGAGNDDLRNSSCRISPAHLRRRG